MKKIVSLFLLGMFLSFSCSDTVFAKIVPKPMYKTTSVRFTSAPEHINADGMDICVINPIGSTTSVWSDITEKSALCGEKTTALSAIGLYVNVDNKGSAPAVISWKNSSLSLVYKGSSKNYGIPFLDGMKYKDAGNPSATPDSVIAPGQKTTIRVYIPDVSFYGSGWIHRGKAVEYGTDFNMILVMSVNGKYVTITTPGINYVEQK